MVIYEDPMSPVAAEADASSHAFTPKEKPTPAKTLFRQAQQKLRDAGAPAAAEDVPVVPVVTPAKKATPASVPDEEPASDRMNVEGQLKSLTHQSQISQDSPSPVMVEPPTAAAQSTPAVANNGNNENAMPHTGKAAEVAAAPRSAAKQKALEEVPVNESGSRFSEARRRSFESLAQSSCEDPAGRCRKWIENRSISPRSKDPANAIDMIRKAQARIKSDTMDISGYRKLQTLFYYHKETIIPDRLEYNSMVNALLKELQKAPTDRKDQDVKTQILVTIRSMLTFTIANFHPCIERTLTTVIRARRHYESSSHIVTYMEELVDILVDHSLTEEAVIDGVIEGMNMGEEALKSEGAYRSIILGLSTLHQTILPAKYEHIPDESLVKVGAVVSEQLRHPRPGVRKQATELNAFINSKFGERLRNLAPPPQEGSLNLLTYFMARQNISG
jgi:CLIP-associating protein 1/2